MMHGANERRRVRRAVKSTFQGSATLHDESRRNGNGVAESAHVDVQRDEAISLFSEASFLTIVSDPRPVSCAERASQRGFRKGMGSWGGSLVVSHHKPANNEAYTTSYTVCSLVLP